MEKLLTSAEQFAKIGVEKSIPKSITNMLDKNRLLLARIQNELNDAELVLIEETKYGEKKYINPLFIALRDTQNLIVGTMRGAVGIAETIEKNRLRPIEESTPQYDGGLEVTFTNYGENNEEKEEDKPLSAKDKIELLKEIKKRENKYKYPKKAKEGVDDTNKT